MKLDWRGVVAAVAPALLLASWSAAAVAILAGALPHNERENLVALLEPHAAPLVLLWLLLSGACGMLMHAAWRRWGVAPERLADELQVLLASDVQRELTLQGSASNRALAGAVNELVRQRARLRDDIAQRVREASRDLEQERTRLAALMSQLPQSVVVCNLDGRVLLYNSRARLQFRALSQAPALAGGAELLGLGRSIYAVLDRALVAHALESIQQRLQRGAPNPATQFVTTTRGGQLLRVQMTPVRAIGAELAAGDAAASQAPPAGAAPALNGFVLMLDNITRDFAQQSESDRVLHALTEGNRASLGNLLAAVEMLDYPELDTDARERFLGVVREEARAMSRRLNELAGEAAQSQKTRWPLEDMLGADLVAAAARRIETLHGCRASTDDVDASLWLRVDSFSLLQALTYLTGRLADELGVRTIELRLVAAEPRAHLDLVWSGGAVSTETVTAWETEAMTVGADATSLTLRDVVERHDGAFWFERDRPRERAWFRFLLPLASEHEQLEAALLLRSDSRPEYYDFDLFRATDQARELADRPLAELSYTVFDTETTGLDPAKGDEIIQIGAARIVAGKLRRHECFEQLVDPQRAIPPESIPIHGIEPAMVSGQPTIDVVLPAFHAFAQDTVLVAHNAAFDMRFLQMKEARTGVRFDQPVLDTLLLSALLHPNVESHRLEAIAERFDVPVLGRHTALGDAIVTAEVFLKMVPLLAEKGIRTLGQAREAAQRTYLARLKY